MRTRITILVATLALATPAGAAASERYVALGDSYSSGVGTRDHSLDADCRRSPYAYPALLERSLPATRLSFRACAGATTEDVLSAQLRSLTPNTDLVTLTAGGNDAGFASVIERCAAPWPVTCWDEIDAAERFVRHDLPGRLARLYGAIPRRSPDAEVVIVGYPRVFNEAEECSAARISPDEQRRLNDVADELARVTRREALARGFGFADPRKAFQGHAACDRHEWINGLSRQIDESFHPNRLGQRAYLRLVRNSLGDQP